MKLVPVNMSSAVNSKFSGSARRSAIGGINSDLNEVGYSSFDYGLRATINTPRLLAQPPLYRGEFAAAAADSGEFRLIKGITLFQSNTD